MKSYQLIAISSICIALSACGGGGGGGTAVTNSPNSTARSIPEVNINLALASVLANNETFTSLASNDGSLRTASYFSEIAESYPYVVNSVSNSVALVKQFQINIDDSAGRLSQRWLWRLHLDSSGNPVGLVSSTDRYQWNNNLCMNSTQSYPLPTTTNGSGQFFTGSTGNFYAGFRSGVYANYCDLSVSSTSKSVEWSVVDGDPKPYACLTFPAMLWTPKVQLCFVTTTAGVLSDKPWIRVINSDGNPSVDFKDTTNNKPYQVFSTTIDPNNYWYGQVWRPSDGYVYRAYDATKFSSELACREQTQIDWKSIYSAVNLSWTCVNVVSR